MLKTNHDKRTFKQSRTEAKKIYYQRQTLNRLEKENENLKKWLTLIKDIGFDYDGYNDIDNLKSLIDELVSYSKYALKGVNYDEFEREENKDE